MSRRRRAVLLLGLATVLGGLAASDVSRREAALNRALGPPVNVVVARAPVRAGASLTGSALSIRRVPARYAPADAYADPADLDGLRAAVPVPAGTDLVPALVAGTSGGAGAVLRPGERAAQIVAGGSAHLVHAGGHVDVLITRDGLDGQTGRTTLALRDAEVLSAAPAVASSASDATPGERVMVSLRVTLAQAVMLTEAQSFARELRVLPRSGA